MFRNPSRSEGVRIVRRWVVLCPPLVSTRQDSVLIDTGGARSALQGLAPTAVGVALSANTETSEAEEQAIRSLEEVLQEGAEAVVTTRAVSEAVKVVEGGQVVGSVDRASLVTVALPIMIALPTMRKLLAGPEVDHWMDPVRAVVGAGGAVRAGPISG